MIELRQDQRYSKQSSYHGPVSRPCRQITQRCS